MWQWEDKSGCKWRHLVDVTIVNVLFPPLNLSSFHLPNCFKLVNIAYSWDLKSFFILLFLCVIHSFLQCAEFMWISSLKVDCASFTNNNKRDKIAHHLDLSRTFLIHSSSSSKKCGRRRKKNFQFQLML